MIAAAPAAVAVDDVDGGWKDQTSGWGWETWSGPKQLDCQLTVRPLGQNRDRGWLPNWGRRHKSQQRCSWGNQQKGRVCTVAVAVAAVDVGADDVGADDADVRHRRRSSDASQVAEAWDARRWTCSSSRLVRFRQYSYEVDPDRV